MSLELMIYLAGIADGIKQAFFYLGLWGSILCLVFIIFTAAVRTDTQSWTEKERKNFSDFLKEHKKLAGLWIYLFPTIFTVSLFIPSDRVIYTIAAANASKQIVQSKDFQTLYGKVYKLIEQKLDENIEEKKP